MSVVDALRDRMHRLLRHDRLQAAGPFLAVLRGARALEVGGPSAAFSPDGALPAYALCDSVDGAQWSARTWWHGRQEEGVYAPAGQPLGSMYVLEAAELGALADASYEVVLSSHVIEHLANPVRALAEWRRVLVPGGHVLVIAPHKEGTFDHRRPVTRIDHMVDDYETGVDEGDLTHLEETLLLHDQSRDIPVSSWEEFAAPRRDNVNNRLLHHHVFVTRTLLELLAVAGLEIRAAEARWPHDIYVLARSPRPGEAVRNAAWINDPARWRSPFRTDRR